MGKKTKKTRWRTLPIDVGNNSSNGSHQSHHHHYKHHERHEDENSRLPSPVPTTETKILFNEDEYTKITTPRQDVLFKKGYFARRRYQQLAAASLLAEATTYETHNGDYGEDEEYASEDYDLNGYYNPPQAYLDPPPGAFYNYGNNRYEVFDPYTGNLTVVMGPAPPGSGHQYLSDTHPVVAAVPCQPVPIEYYNPSLSSSHATPYICPSNFPNSKRFNGNSSSQSFNIHSPESLCPPTSPQDMNEDPNLYPHSFIYPGYMLSSAGYNANGVNVATSLPQTPPCDSSGFKKRKRRKKRKREGVTEEEYESSSEDQRSQSGASEQLDSKTTSDSGVHTHNSGESTPVTPPLSISLHPNIICHAVPPFTSTDEDSPDMSGAHNTSPISCYNTSIGPGHGHVPLHYTNFSMPPPYNGHVNFNGDLLALTSHPVMQDQFLKSRKLKNKKPKSEFKISPYSSTPCSLHSRDLTVPNVPYQKPNEATPTRQLTILKPESPRKFPAPPPPNKPIQILRPVNSQNQSTNNSKKDINTFSKSSSNEVIIAERSTDNSNCKEQSSETNNKISPNPTITQNALNTSDASSIEEKKCENVTKEKITENSHTDMKTPKNSINNETVNKTREKNCSPEKPVQTINQESKLNKSILSLNESKVNSIVNKDQIENKKVARTDDLKNTSNKAKDKSVLILNRTSELTKNSAIPNQAVITTELECNLMKRNTSETDLDHNGNQKPYENGAVRSNNKKQNQKAKKNKYSTFNNTSHQCNGHSEKQNDDKSKSKIINTEIQNENPLGVDSKINVIDTTNSKENVRNQSLAETKTKDKLIAIDDNKRTSSVDNSPEDCFGNKVESSSEQSEELEEGYIKSNPLLANIVDIAAINGNEQKIKSKHRQNKNSLANGGVIKSKEIIGKVKDKGDDITIEKEKQKTIEEPAEPKKTKEVVKDVTIMTKTKDEKVYLKEEDKNIPFNKIIENKTKENHSSLLNGIKENKAAILENGTTTHNNDKRISPLKDIIKSEPKIKLEKVKCEEKKNVQNDLNINGDESITNNQPTKKLDKRKKSGENINSINKIEIKNNIEADKSKMNGNILNKLENNTEKKEVIKKEECIRKEVSVSNSKKPDKEKTQQNKSISENLMKKDNELKNNHEPLNNERKSVSPDKRKTNRKSPSPEKLTKRKNSRKKYSPPPEPPAKNEKVATETKAKLFVDDMLGKAVEQVNNKLENVQNNIQTVSTNNQIVEKKKSEILREKCPSLVNEVPTTREDKLPAMQISQMVNKWLVEEHGGKLPVDFLDDDDEEVEVFVQPMKTGLKNVKSNPSPAVFLNEIMGDRVANRTSDLFEKCNAQDCVKKYYNLGIRASPENEPLNSQADSGSSQNGDLKQPVSPIACGICCLIQ